MGRARFPAVARQTLLTIRAAYDPNCYPKGARITDTELAAARHPSPDTAGTATGITPPHPEGWAA